MGCAVHAIAEALVEDVVIAGGHVRLQCDARQDSGFAKTVIPGLSLSSRARAEGRDPGPISPRVADERWVPARARFRSLGRDDSGVAAACGDDSRVRITSGR